MVDKKELVAQLKEAAQLLEVLGEDAFRARAFHNAARQIDAYDGDFEQLFATGRLTEIRGVGKGVAAELEALREHDTLPLLLELRARVPEGVRELFRVSGLGSRKIALLWGSGIDCLDELLVAAEDGRLAKLKGFGAKSAANLRDAARFALDARERLRLDQAEALAAALLERFAVTLPEAQVAVAGELRRALETVGVLELIVSDAEPEAVRELLQESLDAVDEGGSPSALSGTIAHKRVRVTLVPPPALGAALAVRTGSEAYVAMLQRAAQQQGLRLSEAGLWSGDERLPTPDEAALFARLGLPPVPPERREEAEPAAVLELLRFEQVRGLVHNHSTWSDAAASIREMVAAARARGYAYLAMADHSRTSAYAGGLTIERVYAQAEEVRAIREELRAEGSDFELLHGLEVDILPDGSLDYPDEVLELLDYVVVSVHQQFTLSREAQTERIVRAVRHPLADILGHPSGRLLLRRPPYDVDLAAVIDACAESGTVIEINASPHRLDLDWRWVQRARALGCRFSIDPDAHHPDGFDDVRYGVMMARKAGLTAAEVVNTAPTGRAFLKQLKRASQ